MTKAGRNDPCPCGSGKKFKKCCESKTSKQPLANAQVLTGPNKVGSLFHRHLTPPQEPNQTPEVPPDSKHLNM